MLIGGLACSEPSTAQETTCQLSLITTCYNIHITPSNKWRQLSRNVKLHQFFPFRFGLDVKPLLPANYLNLIKKKGKKYKNQPFSNTNQTSVSWWSHHSTSCITSLYTQTLRSLCIHPFTLKLWASSREVGRERNTSQRRGDLTCIWMKTEWKSEEVILKSALKDSISAVFWHTALQSVSSLLQ